MPLAATWPQGGIISTASYPIPERIHLGVRDCGPCATKADQALVAVTTPEAVVPSTLTISPVVTLVKLGEVTFWSL